MLATHGAVLVIGHLVILSLTWASVRWLSVPEHQELVAGIFLTIVYALFASALITAFAG